MCVPNLRLPASIHLYLWSCCRNAFLAMFGKGIIVLLPLAKPAAHTWPKAQLFPINRFWTAFPSPTSICPLYAIILK